jgi:hypothetical protein
MSNPVPILGLSAAVVASLTIRAALRAATQLVPQSRNKDGIRYKNALQSVHLDDHLRNGLVS